MEDTTKTWRPECGRMNERVDERWLTSGVGVDSGRYVEHSVSHVTPDDAPHTVDS